MEKREERAECQRTQWAQLTRKEKFPGVHRSSKLQECPEVRTEHWIKQSGVY